MASSSVHADVVLERVGAGGVVAGQGVEQQHAADAEGEQGEEGGERVPAGPRRRRLVVAGGRRRPGGQRRSTGRPSCAGSPSARSPGTPGRSTVGRPGRAAPAAPRRRAARASTGSPLRNRRRSSRSPLAVRVAHLRVLGQQLGDDRLVRPGDVGDDLVQRLRVVVDLLVGDADRVLAGERRPAGDHLVHHDAERVEVAARVGLGALGLLGREVRRRAHHRAGLGEVGLGRRVHRPGRCRSRRPSPGRWSRSGCSPA